MTKIYICATTNQLSEVRDYLDNTSITSILRRDEQGNRGCIEALLNSDVYQDRLASIYLSDINRILEKGEDGEYAAFIAK